MDRPNPTIKFKTIILVAVILFGFMAPAVTPRAQALGINPAIVADLTVKGLSYLDQKKTQIENAAAILTSGPLGWAAWVGAAIIDSVSRIDPLNNKFLNCQGNAGGCLGTVIKNAHNFILNLVNVAFLFILLVIAISTIVGAERFSVARLLPRLVIGIILANFGLLFVAQISGISQMLVVGLLGSENLGAAILKATMADRLASNAGQFLVWIIPGVNLSAPFVTFFATLLDPLFWYTIAFFIVAIILVFRLVGLWFLGIAAPLGVAAAVLPSTQQYAVLFWRKVIQYAFIGPVMIFFLRLSLIIFLSISTGPFSSIFAVGSDVISEDDGVVTALSHVMALIFAALTLVIGFIVTKKMGVEVANYTIAGFEKAFKFGFKALKVGGKTAATVAATAVAGPAGGIGAALGLTASEAALAGTAATALGGNIKSEFGSKGAAGAVGNFFSKQGAGLSKYQPELKDLDQTNAASTDKQNVDLVNRANKRIDSNPNLADEAKNDPTAFIDDRIRDPNANVEERDELAYILAKSGGLTSAKFSSVEPLISQERAELIKNEAGNKDPILTIPDNILSTDRAGQLNHLTEFFKRNPFTNISAEAMSNPLVAEAVMRAREGDVDRLQPLMSVADRRALAQGLSGAASATSDTDTKVKYMLKSAELGQNPDQIYQSAGFTNLNATTQSRVTNQIQNDPKFYVNQRPNIAVKMISQVTDPEAAVKIINSKEVSPAARAAIMGEAKRIGGEIDKPGVARALRGNPKFAVERLGEALRKPLKDIQAEAEKATKAAGKAASSTS